jgi:hypothetical protein
VEHGGAPEPLPEIAARRLLHRFIGADGISGLPSEATALGVAAVLGFLFTGSQFDAVWPMGVALE